MSGWPSGLRRQTQDYLAFIRMSFLVHNVGVGSNPIPDTFNCNL